MSSRDEKYARKHNSGCLLCLLLMYANVPGAGVCVKAAGMDRGRDKKALAKA